MSAIQAKPFKIALVQLGGLSADKKKNLELAAKGVEEARKVGKADLIVLPEIFNSPYAVTAFRPNSEPIPNELPAASSSIKGSGSESIQALSRMASENGCWLIGGSIPEIEESTDSIYNTSTVYNPEGNLVAKHRKVHLFDIDIPGKQTFKESETLTGGKSVTTFTTPFGKIGLGICYDIRFPELAMIAARQGCVAMIYPAAFNTTTGPMHWTLLQRASGEVLAEADENPTIVYADVDPSYLTEKRQGLPVTVQRRFDVYSDVAAADGSAETQSLAKDPKTGLEKYKVDFIELAMEKGVLLFGEFTLKSGRLSPYFFNAGLLYSGSLLSIVASAFASTLYAKNRIPDFDVLFGPAYKGIPLAAVTTLQLKEKYGLDKNYTYNRKEKKDHGEGGSLVGAPLKGRVVIIDDVLTAGTAIREAIDILKQHTEAELVGILQLVDRQERGKSETGLSTVQEVEAEFGVPVVPIIALEDIMTYMGGREDLRADLAKMTQYRDTWGIKKQ